MKPCFANFLKKTSDIAEHSTIDSGSTCFAILLIFYKLSMEFQDSAYMEGRNLISVNVIYFVQRTNGRELFVYKCVDHLFDGFV
jgi:hypothetical protein